MKKIFSIKGSVILLLVFAFIFSGCKKFLDKKPLGRYTEDDIPAGSFDSQVFGVYAKMRAFGVSALPYIAIHNIRSDDADKGSSTTDGVDAESFFDNFNYTKDFWLLNQYWEHHYTLILSANDVISDIDSAGTTDQATLVNKAEAKFMRAYAYFNLVRTYGEVPLIDFEVEEASQANIPKSPVSEIWALIDADLMEAATQLPVSWSSTYRGRLTKGAALALQAKAYLFRGNWGAALTAAKQVIGLNQYSLVSDYSSIFREGGENNAESIFEIQAFYSPTQTNVGIQYAQVQGVRGTGSWNLGWGWNTPTRNLANAFETGDPRMDATLLTSGTIDGPYNEMVPDSTVSIPRPFWNEKVYTNPNTRQELGSNGGLWMNLRMIRYADVLLMAAEAATELGGTQNLDDAKGWLELVRARARGSNNSILPPVTTTDQDELRQAIRHERRVELGMENERFFDLVRWGIAQDVLHAAGKTNYQPKHRYLPIPQPEIDKSGGVLVQNPDYQ